MAKLYCKHSDGWAGIVANLELAKAYDKVIIESGDYYGEETLKIPSNISLLGSDKTIFQVYKCPIIEICSENVLLENISFISLAPFSNGQGHAYLFVHDSLNITIKKCFLDGSEDAGNGIYSYKSEDVLIISCSIHRFKVCAINFSSVQGKIIDNQCYANEMHGIQVGLYAHQDHTKVPSNTPPNDVPVEIGKVSDVIISKNRCYSNRLSGIELRNTKTEIIENICWDNQVGILVSRVHNESLANVQPNVIAFNNRCYDNLHGIYVEASAQLIENKCWGNKEAGFLVVTNNFPSIEKTIAYIENNHSFNNNGFGIKWVSAKGEIIRNFCWGNNGIGFLIYTRESKKILSDVVVKNNKSHHNKGNGIQINSTLAVIIGNECWGNFGGGIAIINDSIVSEVGFDEATAKLNRCHHNRGSGIVVTQGNITLTNNKCWSNHNGIDIIPMNGIILNDFKLIVSNNIVYLNYLFGISVGVDNVSLSKNECWNNKIDIYPAESTGGINITLQKNICSVNKYELLIQQVETKLLSLWLQYKIKNNEISLEFYALADFVGEGGCIDCFNKFWQDEEVEKQSNRQTDPVSSMQSSLSNIYGVNCSKNTYLYKLQADAFLHRPLTQETSQPNLNRLNLILETFFNKFHSASQNYDSKLPKWTVALVSNNPKDVDNFIETVKELAISSSSEPVSITVKEFDVSSIKNNNDNNNSSFIENDFFEGKSKWFLWPIFFLKNMFLTFTFPTLVGVFSVLSFIISLYGIFIWLFNMDISPSLLFIRGEFLEYFRVNVSKKIAFSVSVLCYLTLFNKDNNSNLPKSLYVSINGCFKKLCEIFGFPYVVDWFDYTKLKKWSLIKWFFTFSDEGHKRWFKRALFGKKRFKKLPDIAVFFIKNADSLSLSDMYDIQNLIKLHPTQQAALVVTQMSGISMLKNTFLDVWIPHNEPTFTNKQNSYAIDKAYVIHDITSQKLTFELGESKTTNLNELSDILGWERLQIANFKENTREQIFETIIDERYSLYDLLPSIVIGSTPISLHTSLI